jgi:hypothetical protein
MQIVESATELESTKHQSSSLPLAGERDSVIQTNKSATDLELTSQTRKSDADLDSLIFINATMIAP